MNTRERVLNTLQSQTRCTIKDLAEAVEIDPISVRHHIARLEADGLVAFEDERHGVGRPRRVYFLTETGMEKFPTRYVKMSIRLLEQMKQHLPPTMVTGLFSKMAEDILVENIDEKHFSELTHEQRLDLICELLNQEGFSVEWEKHGDEYHIRETNCPYLHVGQNHPEVCTVDQTLISKVLQVPAEKVRCMLNGDTHCTYVIPQEWIVEVK